MVHGWCLQHATGIGALPCVAAGPPETSGPLSTSCRRPLQPCMHACKAAHAAAMPPDVAASAGRGSRPPCGMQGAAASRSADRSMGAPYRISTARCQQACIPLFRSKLRHYLTKQIPAEGGSNLAAQRLFIQLGGRQNRLAIAGVDAAAALPPCRRLALPRTAWRCTMRYAGSREP